MTGLARAVRPASPRIGASGRGSAAAGGADVLVELEQVGRVVPVLASSPAGVTTRVPGGQLERVEDPQQLAEVAAGHIWIATSA